MKTTILGIFLAGTMAFSAAAQGPGANTPTPDVKSASYAMGMRLGASLHFLDVTNIDFDALNAAIKAEMAGGKTEISAADAPRIERSWSNATYRAMAEKSLADGQAFLDNYAKQPGVIKLPSGVCYRVIKDGDGPQPAPTNQVEVTARGRFIDGTIFYDTANDPEPYPFQVNRVIAGWTEILQMMKVGSRWEVAVPGDKAYGARGNARANPPIRPNAPLIYDYVEILKIRPSAPPRGAAGSTTNAPASGRQ